MLEGEISQINLIERLVELWREQFTGAIRFENDGIIKIVYFKGGDILSASTNDRSDSIDEILMRAGKVSREHVKQALAKRKESETLGDALLNLGFITRKELTWARRVQVVGVIRSIAAWTDGSFTIVADYLPKRDEGTLFPLPQVLVELIVTEQDRGRFERALGGGSAVFTKTSDFGEVWRRLGLNEDAEAIASEIDGFKNATEVATASGRDTFNVYKLLHALATLGVLTRADVQVEPQLSGDDFAAAGVADASDAWGGGETTATMPQFQFDHAPSLDVAAPAAAGAGFGAAAADDDFEARVYGDETPTVSAWDDPNTTNDLALDVAAPAAAPPMPAWELPPRDAAALPIPARIEPPADADEEPQWGFDEAQLEASRRAAEPLKIAQPAQPSARPKKSGGRYGLLVALLVIAILAGAGYFGFLWWQGREAENATPIVAAVTTPTPAPTAVTPTDTGTIVPATGSSDSAATMAGATTETTGTSVTGTAAAIVPPATTGAPAPAVITPAGPGPTPAPRPVTVSAEPPPNQALPRVTARPAAGGRADLDTMAREYATNATGNFTVQIQILCDPSNLEKVRRAGGEEVWFVPQTIGERSCYRVFWGRFNTRDEAQRALAEVPTSIRDRNSAVKSVPKR